MRKDFVEQMSNSLAVPPETLGAVPLIHLHGSYSIVIENHRGMIAYDSSTVCIKTKSGMIRVSGERLCIACMTRRTLELRGSIHKVELV